MLKLSKSANIFQDKHGALFIIESDYLFVYLNSQCLLNMQMVDGSKVKYSIFFDVDLIHDYI